MRLIECDLCGSSEFTVLFMQRDLNRSDEVRLFQVVECRACRLIYLNPRPEGKEMTPYYPQEYYERYGAADATQNRPSSWLRRLRKSVRRDLLERFYQYPTLRSGSPVGEYGLLRALKTACLHLERRRLQAIGREADIIPFVGKGRLLDVGCGTGGAMASLMELGWEVSGVDISLYAASRVRERLGCEVFAGNFEDVSLGERRFDVIRFCHSLEHLPSPRRALEKAHRFLQPAGLLWIEVPNAASLDRWIFGRHWFAWELPRHLYHFTPDTLIRLLACTGFRPVKLRGDGRALVFAESVANILAGWFAFRPRGTKLISAMARPLTMALGAMNRAAILLVHARKEETGSPTENSRMGFAESRG